MRKQDSSKPWEKSLFAWDHSKGTPNQGNTVIFQIPYHTALQPSLSGQQMFIKINSD